MNRARRTLVSALQVAILTTLPNTLSAQIGSVRGLVTSTDPRALVGVPIAINGTSLRTQTDSGGYFAFARVPANRYSLRVTPRGRAAITRTISVSADAATNVTIDLDERSRELATVVVAASRPLHVIGHLPDVSDGVIYTGKKTETIVMDSLNANLGQDIERQILGRIPGAHFSETQGAGFPSNGVGFRGLDPTQSIEVNTRQNGVNIAADLYGYSETYFTPPSEALERIEVVRGAASLAFGPQFGGVVNYVTRRGTPNSPLAIASTQTGGSFGLVNSFNSLSGGSGAWTYYGFLHARSVDGWRPNSDLRQVTGYASATYRASDQLTIGLEYTNSWNRIHMPGGLSDEQYAANPDQSLRARNWLASPWSITALRVNYAIAPAVRLETTLAFQTSDRHLVWRNEDGGAAAPDSIDPATGQYVPREVERETFQNTTLESRLRMDYSLLGRPQTLATGLRFGVNRMRRFEGGPGSTGTDFDMTLYGGKWERALRFGSVNAALFAENLIHVTDRLSVTPGVRLEYLRSTADGYTDVDSTFAPRTFACPLVGLGVEYTVTSSTAIYGNVSQAYRPILYASLTPFGGIARVDPNLRTARGYNADLGWRGTAGGVLKFDFGAFYLSYRDRIGTRTVNDGGSFLETANIGDGRNWGVETYLELDPLVLFAPSLLARLGSLDLFSSFAYVDAQYVSGAFAGNRVEQAPRIVDRTGVTYGRGPVAMTLQASYTSSSFGDANNSVRPSVDNGATGPLAAYTVLDWSTRVGLTSRYMLSAGVNNLANVRYFTKRTAEYPGPGILPGTGRSVYAGIAARF